MSDKVKNPLQQIRICLRSGRYQFTKHALERTTERDISIPDIMHVLRKGSHEKAKDCWDTNYDTWNYSIRGRTLEDQLIRVIVSFNEMGLLIITVIRLER